MPAWRSAAGGVSLGRPREESRAAEFFSVPCGGCVGCRMARARDWSVRCWLESQQHERQCWSTLTYDDAHLPPTLDKVHVSAFLKRLRARLHPRSVRFFASGEYGEKTDRPHYHAILYGVSQGERAVQEAWPHGYARTDALSPAAIAYVAGYCTKKHARAFSKRERVDPETGEVYAFQPPFVLMSRRPGIGAAAREYWTSWRKFAVVKGRKVPVPRYLHAAWLEHASDAEIDKLASENKSSEVARDLFPQRLEAAELIAQARLLFSHAKRSL
ncbi:MAG: replication initiator protein [Microviridae sp.]|nr:MAG: replication initiator protein [Microviridae sp.]